MRVAMVGRRAASLALVATLWAPAMPVYANPDVHELSVADFSADETEAVSGTTFSIQVSLNWPAEAAISVTATTEQRSLGGEPAATPGADCGTGVDYVATSDTVEFALGDTTASFPVTVCGDDVDEVSEAFVVVLSAPDNATIVDFEAAVVITNDDDPQVTLEPASMTEDEGHVTAPRQFKLLLDHASNEDLHIGIDSADATSVKATAGSDYQALVEQKVVVAAGDVEATFDVNILGDGVDEQNETFRLLFELLSGGATVPGATVVTIANDDDPNARIDDAQVVEGPDGATKQLQFTVTLSKTSFEDVVITYSTRNGNEPGQPHRNATVEGGDYTAVVATDVTIPNGELSALVTVDIGGDNAVEPDETFYVDITADANVYMVTRAAAVGTIVNDDGTNPEILIGDVSLPEGPDGSVTEFVFPVTLTEPTQATVTVAYATADGTATTSTNDYEAASGTVTFSPGVLQQSITVTVNGDDFPGPNETFFVNLTSPVGALLQSPTQATGTIENDDGPVLTVATTDVVEGAAGDNVTAAFEVTMTETSADDVTVQYTTQDGTATAPDDYLATSGTLTIAAGGLSGTVSVPIVGDDIGEEDETFTLTLSNAVGATLAVAAAATAVTIIDDDLPDLTVTTTPVLEGEAGDNVSALFQATLSQAADTVVTVTYTTQDGTATAPGDYASTTGTLTIAKGAVSGTVAVPIVGDNVAEADETFTLALSDVVGARLAVAAVPATIRNDEDSVLTLAGATVSEGAAGAGVQATFNATLSHPVDRAVTVAYATQDGTALQVQDYVAKSGTLTIPAGLLSGTVSVAIVGDDVAEDEETFTLALSNVVGATLAATTGQATIIDDDGDGLGGAGGAGGGAAGPSLSAASVEVTEGGADDAVTALFTVTLSGASTDDVTVAYATLDQTAVADQDYTATSGTLTILADATSATITVPIIGDDVAEDNESFLVVLSDPQGATIATVTAKATILDDDLAAVEDSTVEASQTSELAPRATDDSCPDGRVQQADYDDIAASAHEAAIDCLLWWGLTQGQTAGSYAPAGTVTRGQMASFIARLLVAGGVALPQDPPDSFADDDGTTHELAINQLAAVGVVAGTAVGQFSPSSAVSRGQMATFMVNAHEAIIGIRLTSDQDFFADFDSVHQEAINALAQAGVAVGSGGLYRPHDTVTRAQMASFIVRLLDLVVEAGRATPPS